MDHSGLGAAPALWGQELIPLRVAGHLEGTVRGLKTFSGLSGTMISLLATGSSSASALVSCSSLWGQGQ